MVFPTFLPCEVAGWCGGCLKCILLHIFNIIFIFLLSFLCRYERRVIYFVDFFFLITKSSRTCAPYHKCPRILPVRIPCHCWKKPERMRVCKHILLELSCVVMSYCFFSIKQWNSSKEIKKKFVDGGVYRLNGEVRRVGISKKKRRNLHTCKLNAWIMHATWAS